MEPVEVWESAGFGDDRVINGAAALLKQRVVEITYRVSISGPEPFELWRRVGVARHPAIAVSACKGEPVCAAEV